MIVKNSYSCCNITRPEACLQDRKVGYLLEVYLTDYFYFYQCVGMIVTTFQEQYYSFVVSESVSDHMKFLFWGSISLEHPVIAQTLVDEKVHWKIYGISYQRRETNKLIDTKNYWDLNSINFPGSLLSAQLRLDLTPLWQLCTPFFENDIVGKQSEQLHDFHV